MNKRRILWIVCGFLLGVLVGLALVLRGCTITEQVRLSRRSIVFEAPGVYASQERAGEMRRAAQYCSHRS